MTEVNALPGEFVAPLEHPDTAWRVVARTTYLLDEQPKNGEKYWFTSTSYFDEERWDEGSLVGVERECPYGSYDPDEYRIEMALEITFIARSSGYELTNNCYILHRNEFFIGVFQEDLDRFWGLVE